tara:strand:- start:1152 stop:1391 length:240 start_codon:yes stop_codon:yes gene_type:complete
MTAWTASHPRSDYRDHDEYIISQSPREGKMLLLPKSNFCMDPTNLTPPPAATSPLHHIDGEDLEPSSPHLLIEFTERKV